MELELELLDPSEVAPVKQALYSVSHVDLMTGPVMVAVSTAACYIRRLLVYHIHVTMQWPLAGTTHFNTEDPLQRFDRHSYIALGNVGSLPV